MLVCINKGHSDTFVLHSVQIYCVLSDHIKTHLSCESRSRGRKRGESRSSHEKEKQWDEEDRCSGNFNIVNYNAMCWLFIFVAISLPEHQKAHVQTYVGWKINSLNKIFNSCEGLKVKSLYDMWSKGSDKYVSINKDWEERRTVSKDDRKSLEGFRLWAATASRRRVKCPNFHQPARGGAEPRHDESQQRGRALPPRPTGQARRHRHGGQRLPRDRPRHWHRPYPRLHEGGLENPANWAELIASPVSDNEEGMGRRNISAAGIEPHLIHS